MVMVSKVKARSSSMLVFEMNGSCEDSAKVMRWVFMSKMVDIFCILTLNFLPTVNVSASLEFVSQACLADVNLTFSKSLYEETTPSR